MRFVAAPDSFKGSLSAIEASLCIERGVKGIFPDAVVQKFPIADGGEGLVKTVIAAAGGNLIEVQVVGPIGQTVKAVCGILDDGETGLIEVASACGLPLVGPEQRNPEQTTSYGVGELILKLVDSGCRRIVVGLGGSATNDGGVGMASALGIRFLDSERQIVETNVGNLEYVSEIDLSGLDPRLAEVEIIGACDVDSPLCGPHGASAVFGPQKGATPEQVNHLDHLLQHLGTLLYQTTGRNIAEIPGAGAAGGLGAGLLGFLGARLVKGSALVLGLIGLDQVFASGGIDLVITGEGEINGQTVLGKAPIAVAELAKRYGLPIVAMTGSLGPGYTAVYQHGIDSVQCIVSRPMSLEEAMHNAASMLEDAVDQLIRTWQINRGRGINSERLS
ncbi:glycerate kinase [Desulfosporosinus metallidurans]|uniref:Glycerate kinase n=1 Tax=Desulfosporosinus metallidurans TaxID=1888891 RepID=A0A1Q8QXG5_9FIRM|nr:glycerate kinase [Desulfosporosinus metallidurans]OLN31970.1 Glycerate kinase [Desulfosporosinus metallidurans]